MAKNQADDSFVRGKYKEAFSVYEKMEKMGVKDEELEAAIRFQQGYCRFKEKRNSDALSIWSRMRSYYPKSSYAPKSLLLEADDPGSAGKAVRLYDEILSKYPVSEEAATILEKRGQQAFDRKDYKEAQENWKRLVMDFPVHAHLTEVQNKLETVELVLGGDRVAQTPSAAGVAELGAVKQ